MNIQRGMQEKLQEQESMPVNYLFGCPRHDTVWQGHGAIASPPCNATLSLRPRWTNRIRPFPKSESWQLILWISCAMHGSTCFGNGFDLFLLPPKNNQTNFGSRWNRVQLAMKKVFFCFAPSLPRCTSSWFSVIRGCCKRRLLWATRTSTPRRSLRVAQDDGPICKGETMKIEWNARNLSWPWNDDWNRDVVVRRLNSPASDPMARCGCFSHFSAQWVGVVSFPIAKTDLHYLSLPKIIIEPQSRCLAPATREWPTYDVNKEIVLILLSLHLQQLLPNATKSSLTDTYH